MFVIHSCARWTIRHAIGHAQLCNHADHFIVTGKPVVVEFLEARPARVEASRESADFLLFFQDNDP